MNRRHFLGAAGALALGGGLPAVAQGGTRPMSRAAQHGWLPNVPLVGHDGRTYNFYDDLARDKTFVLSFFVVACADGRCPTANFNLRKVQDMLGDRMGRDIFFYTVSLEPEKDTQPILKEYAEDIIEAAPGWLFLTGKPNDIDTLRRAQGFYDQDPERDRDVSNHSSMARVICDRRERWGTATLMTSPRNIYSVIRTL